MSTEIEMFGTGLIFGMGFTTCPGCRQLMTDETELKPYARGLPDGEHPDKMLCAVCYLQDVTSVGNRQLQKDREAIKPRKLHYRYG